MEKFKPTEFKPVKTEKVLTSLRIDVEKLNQIDILANKTDISRNEFIVQCIDFAIKHLSEESP